MSEKCVFDFEFEVLVEGEVDMVIEDVRGLEVI